MTITETLSTGSRTAGQTTRTIKRALTATRSRGEMMRDEQLQGNRHIFSLDPSQTWGKKVCAGFFYLSASTSWKMSLVLAWRHNWTVSLLRYWRHQNTKYSKLKQYVAWKICHTTKKLLFSAVIFTSFQHLFVSKCPFSKEIWFLSLRPTQQPVT